MPVDPKKPITVGTKNYANTAQALVDIRKTKPGVKEPLKYVLATQKIIADRRAAKADRSKKHD